jgi:molybdate transport system substrate-binding protein
MHAPRGDLWRPVAVAGNLVQGAIIMGGTMETSAGEKGWRRALLAGFFALLAACRGAGGPDGDAGPGGRQARLVVFAAASLKDGFEALRPAFEARHPGVEVACSFAGTHTLRVQLEHGAEADVFAGADAVDMAALAATGKVKPAGIVARNVLGMVVAREHAASLRGFGDLARAPSVVLGADDVPVGRYADRLIDAFAEKGQDMPGWTADFAARVRARVVSREPSAREVLARVALGEAAAGLVYQTDARAAEGAVSWVEAPAGLAPEAAYPVGLVAGSPRATLAEAFVSYLRSEAGQRVLEAAGFLPGDPAGAP